MTFSSMYLSKNDISTACIYLHKRKRACMSKNDIWTACIYLYTAQRACAFNVCSMCWVCYTNRFRCSRGKLVAIVWNRSRVFYYTAGWCLPCADLFSLSEKRPSERLLRRSSSSRRILSSTSVDEYKPLYRRQSLDRVSGRGTLIRENGFEAKKQ